MVDEAPPEIAESKVVDVIIPLGDLDSFDEAFWDAQGSDQQPTRTEQASLSGDETLRARSIGMKTICVCAVIGLLLACGVRAADAGKSASMPIRVEIVQTNFRS